MKTPVYYGEGRKNPPFGPTLVPTVVASSQQGKLEKAASKNFPKKHEKTKKIAKPLASNGDVVEEFFLTT